MADYLSRDVVLRKLIEGDGHDDDRFTEGYNFAVQEYREKVKNMPAADVKTVIHAEWILFDKDCCGRAFYCSNCRKVTTTDDFENTPLEREEYFCPRCGADMRNE